MSWEDSLKKYRTNVSGSGVVPLDHVLKDHKELGMKLRGLIGAVGALRNNVPRRVSKVIAKLDEIKREIQATHVGHKHEDVIGLTVDSLQIRVENDLDPYELVFRPDIGTGGAQGFVLNDPELCGFSKADL